MHGYHVGMNLSMLKVAYEHHVLTLSSPLICTSLPEPNRKGHRTMMLSKLKHKEKAEFFNLKHAPALQIGEQVSLP
jgi:hypothetical protein